MRDVLTDPQAGDVVQGVWHSPRVHRGVPALITVQARIGNLVATSSDGDKQILWIRLEDFCKPDGWIAQYHVIHTAKNDAP